MAIRVRNAFFNEQHGGSFGVTENEPNQGHFRGVLHGEAQDLNGMFLQKFDQGHQGPHTIRQKDRELADGTTLGGWSRRFLGGI